MKVIILAAGKGTRLGGLTADIPKPMLPINGKPLLYHIITYLKNNNIDEDFLVIYGDILTNQPLAPMVQQSSGICNFAFTST